MGLSRANAIVCEEAELAARGTRQQVTVRVEESQQEVDRLLAELRWWLAIRHERDRLGQYESQLLALESSLGTVLRAIKHDLDALGPGDDAGAAFARCRANDRRTVFTRRCWTFFRERFDQRDDEAVAPLLAAADEVVWSCYSEAFTTVGLTPVAAPLPYVEPLIAPRALARTAPPPELAADARDTVLREALAIMPIPLIGLPSVCVARPWWLVYVAHEAGHQIQADLDDGALLTAFPALINDAVADPDSPWRSWARECFADAVSALEIGRSAPEAMTELEAGDDAAMLRPVLGYPPPVLRRSLMEGVLEPAPLAPNAAPAAIERARITIVGAELDPTEEGLRTATLESLEQLVPILASIATTTLAGLGTLAQICGWRADREQTVGAWREDFSADAEPFPQATRQAARLAIAGAYQAWSALTRADVPTRAAGQERLGARILATVPRCREMARRAAPEIASPVRAAAAGSALAELVMKRVAEGER